jgi:hypothetical protein
MSLQVLADASQKFTCPFLIAFAPTSTFAVSVTAVADGTDVTAVPWLVSVRLVLVAGNCPHSGIVAEVLEL